MKMILTGECEECCHGWVDYTDKSKVIVHCKVKNKTYHYGQCIPCDEKKSVKTQTLQNDGKTKEKKE